VMQIKEDVDVGWLMVGLEYQAAAPPKLQECLTDVVTVLSIIRESAGEVCPTGVGSGSNDYCKYYSRHEGHGR
jgi:hypothetical protein